jgi:hypothetical protein
MSLSFKNYSFLQDVGVVANNKVHLGTDPSSGGSAAMVLAGSSNAMFKAWKSISSGGVG